MYDFDQMIGRNNKKIWFNDRPVDQAVPCEMQCLDILLAAQKMSNTG